MNANALKKWCKKRRGRAAALAEKIGKSREFVRQMGTRDRPIPVEIAELLPAAMQRIEADEQTAHAVALERINAP